MVSKAKLCSPNLVDGLLSNVMQGMMGKLSSALGPTSHSTHRALSRVPGGLVLFVTFVISMDDSVVGLFQDATLCTIHGKHKTLMVKDIGLVCRLHEPLPFMCHQHE